MINFGTQCGISFTSSIYTFYIAQMLFFTLTQLLTRKDTHTHAETHTQKMYMNIYRERERERFRGVQKTIFENSRPHNDLQA